MPEGSLSRGELFTGTDPLTVPRVTTDILVARSAEGVGLDRRVDDLLETA
jgi:hypothetical protein